MDSGAHSQDGAVELTGSFGVVLHVVAVLLHKVLVGDALLVLLDLDGFVVGCAGEESERVGIKQRTPKVIFFTSCDST